MPLNSGDKLGHYEILSAIGAGGMGEVYKARDPRLNRIVAIKVLPDHIARREDLRARFQREARAVASLNHPNICTLHDIGDQDGTGYMVMEFIDGETLAARIKKGPLPIDQAIQFTTQIADALDRAHRAGVTHRDVKPQNIMLTRDGAKILDFGLVKTTQQPGPGEDTLTASLTTEGAILGTPQYMAPEQFEGKEADARSDVWALGAVLYEMVTGAKAFKGKNYNTLVSAILSAEPEPMALQRFTPTWLERLVRRCLAKDPENRWQSMRDIVIELGAPPQEQATPTTSSPSRWIAAAVALTLALVVAAAGWYKATRPSTPRPLLRLKVEISPEAPLARGGTNSGIGGHMLAISPEGTRLALTLKKGDSRPSLYTRLLNQSELTPLPGTESAHSPFFSPAGDWIGFFSADKLKKISVDGGLPVTLCDAPAGYGASWGDDGNIIVSIQGLLNRVPSAGGNPVAVTKLANNEWTHRWPQVLPGSEVVLFTSAKTGVEYNDANIESVSLKTGERKTIQTGAFSGRYVGGNSTGHLIYQKYNSLLAVPFHLNRLAPTGTPVPILEDVSSTGAAGGDFAFSRNGTFVYPGKLAARTWPISWLDRAGKTQPLHAPLGQYFFPAFSPDGKRLAFSIESGKGQEIWVKDLERDTLSQLTRLPGVNSHAVWTSDGKKIIFRASNAAAPGLYAIPFDGSGEAVRLTDGNPVTWPHSMSPDGKWLAVQREGHIFTIPLLADSEQASLGFKLGEAKMAFPSASAEVYPFFSPDGRWLAYLSNESGTYEAYVRPFPGPGGRWQISNGGAGIPHWSRNGRDLLFVAPDRSIRAVTYTTQGDTFTASKPWVWSEAKLVRAGSSANYDVAPDGQRIAAFLESEATPDQPPTHLIFLLNFFDELARKVPASK